MIESFITWDANPILFNFGPLHIRWYGLMFAIGFWIGTNIVSNMFKHEGKPESWVGILLIYTVAGTIIGARLGHVFFYEYDYYMEHPGKIIAFWEGGLASHGGLIGIVVAVCLFSWFTTKLSPIWTLDRLCIPTALVGGLIRIGNLFNSEIYGHPTDLPWGFIYIRGHEWPGEACHPTQIYEAVAYLLLFGFLMWLYWKKNEEERPGLILGVFFIWVFAARFFIEFLKNPQVDFEQNMAINMGQILSIPVVLIGIFLVVRALMKPRLSLKFPDKFAPESK